MGSKKGVASSNRRKPVRQISRHPCQRCDLLNCREWYWNTNLTSSSCISVSLVSSNTRSSTLSHRSAQLQSQWGITTWIPFLNEELWQTLNETKIETRPKLKDKTLIFILLPIIWLRIFQLTFERAGLFRCRVWQQRRESSYLLPKWPNICGFWRPGREPLEKSCVSREWRCEESRRKIKR